MDFKILIVYYSHSGNTEHIAKLIQAQTNGTLFKIQPQNDYPISYNSVLKQALKEIKEGFRPQLKNKIDFLENYNILFVGTPNWWNTIAPPVSTFLSQSNLSDKIIIPFCTSGSGGVKNIMCDIKKLCPNSKILDAFQAYDSDSIGAIEIALWLKELNSRNEFKNVN